MYIAILIALHGVSGKTHSSTCESQNDPLCVVDNADQGGSLLASHFDLERSLFTAMNSDEHHETDGVLDQDFGSHSLVSYKLFEMENERQYADLKLHASAWSKNNNDLVEAAEAEKDALTKFLRAQKKSGDACSSRLLEAKRSLDALLHDLKSLSMQVKDHMTVLEAEDKNLNATQLSIDAAEDQNDEESAKCEKETEKALEDLAQYTAELKELKQIADPSVRYEHIVTVEGMPQAPSEDPSEANAAFLEEQPWSKKSCEAFVAYAKQHQDMKFISALQEHSLTNTTKPRFRNLGPGCCSGKVDQSRPALMSQATWKGSRDNLKACKEKCKMEGAEKCGFIEYGWKNGKGKWCVVHPPETECSSTKAGPKDCGSGGGDNGVRAYKFLADAPEKGLTPVGRDCNCGKRIQEWRKGKTVETCNDACNSNPSCKSFGFWTGAKDNAYCALFNKACSCDNVCSGKPTNVAGGWRNDVYNKDTSLCAAEPTDTSSDDGDSIDDGTFDAEKPISPIHLNCDQQRDKLQRIFAKAYNAVKDLKKEASDRSKDDTCQETADAKKASLLVPLVAQREQAAGRIVYSQSALAALEPVLKQVENRVKKLQNYIDAKLTPECEEASEVSKYLQNVRDLIISLQNCPGRNDFALKIPTDKDPESKYFQKCFDTSYGKICGTRMRTGGKKGNGHYMMTPTTARQACKELNSKLCTLKEVKLAHEQGVQWCSWGFVTDDNMYSIMQETKEGCPDKGVNGPTKWKSGKGNAWCCSKF